MSQSFSVGANEPANGVSLFECKEGGVKGIGRVGAVEKPCFTNMRRLLPQPENSPRPDEMLKKWSTAGVLDSKCTAALKRANSNLQLRGRAPSPGYDPQPFRHVLQGRAHSTTSKKCTAADSDPPAAALRE
jgi:hypothetical protein